MGKKVLPDNQVLLDMDPEIEEEGKAAPVVLEGDMVVVDGIEILVLGEAALEGLPGLPDGETIGEEAQVATEVRRVPVEHTDDIIFRFQSGDLRGLVQTLKT